MTGVGRDTALSLRAVAGDGRTVAGALPGRCADRVRGRRSDRTDHVGVLVRVDARTRRSGSGRLAPSWANTWIVQLEDDIDDSELYRRETTAGTRQAAYLACTRYYFQVAQEGDSQQGQDSRFHLNLSSGNSSPRITRLATQYVDIRWTESHVGWSIFGDPRLVVRMKLIRYVLIGGSCLVLVAGCGGPDTRTVSAASMLGGTMAEAYQRIGYTPPAPPPLGLGVITYNLSARVAGADTPGAPAGDWVVIASCYSDAATPGGGGTPFTRIALGSVPPKVATETVKSRARQGQFNSALTECPSTSDTFDVPVEAPS